MLITIDTDRGIVRTEQDSESRDYAIGSPEAFKLLSRAWLRSGWDAKYVYGFTWLGRPMIQLPEDMLRLQEVIYRLKPDVIIETGIAHGGSAVFSASMCKLMGKGRVVAVDIEIRPHNRRALEAHELSDYITLIEGSSTAPSVVESVSREVKPGETVMIFLDSCHTKQHVLAELEAYGPLVTPGSYIVAMDGIMEEVVGAPRTEPDWTWNNPKQAALDFVANDPRFVIDEPEFAFNEGEIRERVTYWPCAFIKRLE
jgi:cephalosporin hydroxylase